MGLLRKNKDKTVGIELYKKTPEEEEKDRAAKEAEKVRVLEASLDFLRVEQNAASQSPMKGGYRRGPVPAENMTAVKKDPVSADADNVKKDAVSADADNTKKENDGKTDDTITADKSTAVVSKATPVQSAANDAKNNNVLEQNNNPLYGNVSSVAVKNDQVSNSNSGEIQTASEEKTSHPVADHTSQYPAYVSLSNVVKYGRRMDYKTAIVNSDHLNETANDAADKAADKATDKAADNAANKVTDHIAAVKDEKGQVASNGNSLPKESDNNKTDNNETEISRDLGEKKDDSVKPTNNDGFANVSGQNDFDTRNNINADAEHAETLKTSMEKKLPDENGEAEKSATNYVAGDALEAATVNLSVESKSLEAKSEETNSEETNSEETNSEETNSEEINSEETNSEAAKSEEAQVQNSSSVDIKSEENKTEGSDLEEKPEESNSKKSRFRKNKNKKNKRNDSQNTEKETEADSKEKNNEETSKTDFIPNPLPVPKRHVPRELVFDFEPEENDMHFDLVDMTGKDYFDIN